MSAAAQDRVAVDPITVEVISSALSSITEEMGEALVRASYSTNIKERRDCSTALFNTAGETLCQAEHIPMHLGSFIGILPHIRKRFPEAQIAELLQMKWWEWDEAALAGAMPLLTSGDIDGLHRYWRGLGAGA